MGRMLDPPRPRRLELFQGKSSGCGRAWAVPRATPPEAAALIPPDPPPVDLRGLPPPEPLERILSAIASDPAERLSFLLSMEPLLLYGLLRRERVRWHVQRVEAGVELTIERGARKA
jgi:hypothetical protein